MTTYATEDEQVEAIKKWWKENGLSVAAGLILGASLLLGWQAWQAYTQQKAETASAQYEQVLLAIEKKQSDQLQGSARALLADYSSSPYASLAALALAKQAVDDNQLDAAHAHLQWVLDHGKPAHVKHIARLRKAQLFLDQDNIAAAKEVLKVPEKADFVAAYAELEGDIALAEEALEAARVAYQSALDYKELNSAHRRLLQMKLDNVGQSDTDHLLAQAPELPAAEETPPANPIEMTLVPDQTGLPEAIPSIEVTPVTETVEIPAETPVVETVVTPAETPVVETVVAPAETPVVETVGIPAETPVVETVVTPAETPVVETVVTPTETPVVETVVTPAETPVVETTVENTQTPTPEVTPSVQVTPVTETVQAQEVAPSEIPPAPVSTEE
ncbi:YfgM family protein [Thioflexithrix psekupsensis]|uniref:Ancillary SecYEG translocon subunit/Cell division coordinator CpoB TPR domain-containing protein n=1 Tax=Thioflexithrix psekupsensis TaxID=1570016 RepID=A0A251X7W9_9GAMM|nr:tetratricopeptide repeat protein [Thioflexithrix psekupsensis]OUD14071.1 hypothetical protein TPSD3_06955 [Thioflexithrix psekupsensis]